MKPFTVLKELGLEKKQAEVYLACLELGTASAYRIAKKLAMPRSTCYETLDNLLKMGFVSTFRKKKVRVFTAEDPKAVLHKGQEKLEDFEEALPQFNALFATVKHQPTVRFYQGTEGMKTIFGEVLEEATEILGFASADDLFENLGEYWKKYLKQRIAKKIPVRTILKSSKRARQRKRVGVKHIRRVKILPKEFDHDGIIVLWENKIAMFSFKKEMMAIVIESPILAQTQKTMFEALWNSLEE